MTATEFDPWGEADPKGHLRRYLERLSTHQLHAAYEEFQAANLLAEGRIAADVARQRNRPIRPTKAKVTT